MLGEVPPVVCWPVGSRTNNALGPVIVTAQESTQDDRLQDLSPRPYAEGQKESLTDATYTNGSIRDPALQQTALSVKSSTKDSGLEIKRSRSS